MSTVKHGSRTRYQQGCRCVACSRSNYRRQDQPSTLRWPLRFITNRFDRELVQDHLTKYLNDPQEWAFYRENGLSDVEADHLAISFGEHPMAIWPGWIEAGLDV